MAFLRSSRRQFLASTFKAGAAFQADSILAQMAPAGAQPYAGGAKSLLEVDRRRLVSNADLHYAQPVTRSEEGIPIGNGRMGTLVWTEPTAIKMQINRVDVFAEDCSTNSFPRRNTDYGSSCGYVDIDFGDFGDDVFVGPAFSQSLHVYDGISTVTGDGVRARALACVNHDVIAVEIDDRRAQPSSPKIDLRMLRHAVQYLSGQNYELMRNHSVKVVKRNHSATSTLAIRNGCILLIQKFEEGGYYNASAVAVKVTGRASKAKYATDSTVRLGVAPGAGKWTAWIASASSFDRTEDLGEKVLAELASASPQYFDSLVATNRIWWNDFWARSFVHLDGDNTAKEVETNYTYFLYLMGASSRGSYMPRFGGMLWFSNGDMREWGSQFWWSNQNCYYNALPPANRPELLQPVFDTYSGMRESCALAAQQQWGSQGIYIPETTWFNGLQELSDEMAAEIRDLYLLRKPWDQHSAAFYRLAETKLAHNSRWNWKATGEEWVDGHWVWKDRGFGPYGPVTHIFSSSAKIAFLYWIQYEHLQNRDFLRRQAYPMLKGVAEFYRNYPNLQKLADGKYHILHVNNSEPVWGARDTQEEISAMMGIFPVAARAADILDVDTDLRAKWREVHENLADLPTNASPDAPNRPVANQPEIWISGLPPVINGNIGRPGVFPALYFDLCCVETADKRMIELGQNTFQALHPRGIDASVVVTVLSSEATAAANLGRSEDMRYLLPSQILNSEPGRGYCDPRGSGPPRILANRMSLREGSGAIGAERLGRMSEALHTALLQSNPPQPGGDPIIHVFPAWPSSWEAQFTLSARDGFWVTSSFAHGAVEFVELRARVSNTCRLRNPWKSAQVALFRNGREAGWLQGDILEIPAATDETLVVAPVGRSLASLRRSI